MFLLSGGMAHISHSCRDVIVLAILFDFECFTGNRENPLRLRSDFVQILKDAMILVLPVVPLFPFTLHIQIFFLMKYFSLLMLR